MNVLESLKRLLVGDPTPLMEKSARVALETNKALRAHAAAQRDLEKIREVERAVRRR